MLSPAARRVKKELGLRQRLCPICLKPLSKIGLRAVGDGHHVIVRRLPVANQDLLWDERNIRLVHHGCHMDHGSFNIHAIAMILEENDWDIDVILDWLNSLGLKSDNQGVVSGDLNRVWQSGLLNYGVLCPSCHTQKVRRIDNGIPAKELVGAVCWNCWRVWYGTTD